MKTYIGTKIVEAHPMNRGEYNEYRGWTIPKDENPADEGFLVKYHDNYESWSPKYVFEKAYLPVVTNPELRTNAPSISQQMVDEFIDFIDVQTMGTKTTVVRATLKNGFEIVETSACVSVENYDDPMGENICLEKIKDKVWMLLGFLLQTAVNGVNGTNTEGKEPEGPDIVLRRLTFGLALEAAKKGKRIARAGWNGKGQWVELGKNFQYERDGEELKLTSHEDIGSQALVFCGTRGCQVGWLASQADMLAEDWMVLE